MNIEKLKNEIVETINRNSAENGSDTHDFILGEYLIDCLNAFDKAVNHRDKMKGYNIKEEMIDNYTRHLMAPACCSDNTIMGKYV